MKLIFKQKLFSWFDSYNVYNTAEERLFTVKGQLSWGHLLKIYDANNLEVGTVREKIFSLLPRFEIYKDGQYIGCIKKEFTFFRPKFTIDFKGWSVKGDWFEWDYDIVDSSGQIVATVSKELLNWTDTYSIDVCDPSDALTALMLVIAIDAEKCSRND